MTTGIGGWSPSPYVVPSLWDSVTLGGAGGFTWTSRVDFHNARRVFSWQNKKGPGQKGTIDTFRGTHTHPFEMRVYVWTTEQWLRLPDLLAFFAYDDAKLGPDGLPLTNPVDIYHPALASVGISQVYCEWIEAPDVHKDRDGMTIIRFGLHEYLLPVDKNVTNTPKAVQVPIVVLNSNRGSTGQRIAESTQQLQNESAHLGDAGVLP